MCKAKGSGLGPPPSEKACIDKGQTETKPYLLQLYRFWKPDRESKEWNKDHAAPRSAGAGAHWANFDEKVHKPQSKS